MKQVLLDTNFILTCIKQKIDFFEDLKLRGIEIIIPEQVIGEIHGLSNSKEEAKIALKLLQKNKFKKADLKTKNVDKGIIKYAKDKTILVGTLDREIKKGVKNPKLLIRGKKKLEIV